MRNWQIKNKGSAEWKYTTLKSYGLVTLFEVEVMNGIDFGMLFYEIHWSNHDRIIREGNYKTALNEYEIEVKDLKSQGITEKLIIK